MSPVHDDNPPNEESGLLDNVHDAVNSEAVRDALSTSGRLVHAGKKQVKMLWGGFVDFALQGNVLEIAFGLMYVHSLRSPSSHHHQHRLPAGLWCDGIAFLCQHEASVN